MRPLHLFIYLITCSFLLGLISPHNPCQTFGTFNNLQITIDKYARDQQFLYKKYGIRTKITSNNWTEEGHRYLWYDSMGREMKYASYRPFKGSINLMYKGLITYTSNNQIKTEKLNAWYDNYRVSDSGIDSFVYNHGRLTEKHIYRMEFQYKNKKSKKVKHLRKTKVKTIYTYSNSLDTVKHIETCQSQYGKEEYLSIDTSFKIMDQSGRIISSAFDSIIYDTLNGMGNIFYYNSKPRKQSYQILQRDSFSNGLIQQSWRFNGRLNFYKDSPIACEIVRFEYNNADQIKNIIAEGQSESLYFFDYDSLGLLKKVIATQANKSQTIYFYYYNQEVDFMKKYAQQKE